MIVKIFQFFERIPSEYYNIALAVVLGFIVVLMSEALKAYEDNHE